jgi:mRNA-degrading endonuclease RelE of RelBE toxin-antitoxin system
LTRPSEWILLRRSNAICVLWRKSTGISCSDVKPLIEQLQEGETPGNQVPGIALVIYKVRVRNSDLQRGKSGGYRIIYYLKPDTQITLVTIYSKTKQADVTVKDVRDFLDGYFAGGAAALDL